MRYVKETIGLFIFTGLLAGISGVAPAQRRGSAAKQPSKPKPATARTARTAGTSKTAVQNPQTPSPKELAAAATQSREKLVEASRNYRESLEKLLALQKQDETRAQDLVKRRQELLALGVIARREVEESEAALEDSRKKMTDTNQRLDEVDQLVAEVVASEQLANQPVEAQMPDTAQRRVMLVRYIGKAGWSLASDVARVEAFYQQRFGKALPISAFGQTETHNRLGFDHTNALDVAVHPDSSEGLTLQAFLRGQGISFIAIRGAIAGSATGAHIHIGQPSRRMVWTQ